MQCAPVGDSKDFTMPMTRLWHTPFRSMDSGTFSLDTSWSLVTSDVSSNGSCATSGLDTCGSGATSESDTSAPSASNELDSSGSSASSELDTSRANASIGLETSGYSPTSELNTSGSCSSLPLETSGYYAASELDTSGYSATSEVGTGVSPPGFLCRRRLFHNVECSRTTAVGSLLEEQTPTAGDDPGESTLTAVPGLDEDPAYLRRLAVLRLRHRGRMDDLQQQQQHDLTVLPWLAPSVNIYYQQKMQRAHRDYNHQLCLASVEASTTAVSTSLSAEAEQATPEKQVIVRTLSASPEREPRSRNLSSTLQQQPRSQILPATPQSHLACSFISKPFTAHARRVLKTWHQEHGLESHPSSQQLQDLAITSRLSEEQVRHWLISRRHRSANVRRLFLPY